MEDKKYTLKEHIIYFVSNEESVHTKRKCKSVDSLSSIGCYLYHAAFNMVMIIGLYALFIFGTFSLFTITESIFIVIVLGTILTVFPFIPFCGILLGSIVKYVPILALPVYLIFLFASLFEHNILSDYGGFTSYYIALGMTIFSIFNILSSFGAENEADTYNLSIALIKLNF